MKLLVSWSTYTANAYLAEHDIFCYASLFLLYDKPEQEKIWKKRLYELCKDLKIMYLGKKDKKKATYIALVVMSHGTYFQYDKTTIGDVFIGIRAHMDMPNEFSHEMSRKYNQHVFFSSLNKFYNEFLIPWICDTNGKYETQEFYDAVNLYLINNRITMV